MCGVSRRIALFVALLAAIALTPVAVVAGPLQKPGKGNICGPGGRFCAGAATADITPPVTSPQFAYTFRHCAVAAPAETGGHLLGIEEHAEEGQMWLLGLGPSCLGDKRNGELYSKTFPPSEGTYGRLVANAFVLDDGKGERVAIVQADLGGIPGELHTEVARLAGIEREKLLISATHTHGSVGGIFTSAGYAALGGDLFDRRIFDAVARGIANAVTEATSRLEPARLAVGFGTIANANGNRRTSAWSRNPEASLPGATPQAHRLMAIRVDSKAGVPLGLITNFTNHGVIHGTFNQFLSGDNQAQATRQVTRAIRQKAEAAGVRFPAGWEVVDTLTNGPAGDITPRSDDGGVTWTGYGSIEGPAFREFARMEEAGSRQVAEAVRLWESLGTSLTTDVTLDAALGFTCFCGQAVGRDDHDPYDDEVVGVDDDPRYFAMSDTAILGNDDGSQHPRTVHEGHHHKIARLVAGPTVAPPAARVQLIRINDLALASMPGEPSIQMGRRIEKSVLAEGQGLFQHVVLVGLANDYASYMVTPHEYEEYAYEGGFSLWGQQTGNALKNRLLDLTTAMRTGEAAGCRDGGCESTELPLPPKVTDTITLLDDPLVGTASVPHASLRRAEGTSFSWYGGAPTTEWSPDDPIVELQRWSGTAWTSVASDLDPEVPVRYQREDGRHRWTAYFDSRLDETLGSRYRFAVSGHARQLGRRVDYAVTSPEFVVDRTADLRIQDDGDRRFRVTPPLPDGLRNFRARPRVVDSALVSTTDGRVLGPTFQLASGDSVTIPAGGIVDAFGNTNDAAITLG